MNRNRLLLLIAVALLMIGNFIWYGWMHWGLITIHAKEPNGLPLSKVIQQIESQGHVTVKTNIDGTTPVHMWVTNVTLADALETLAAVTDARWRLAFFVAPDKTSIKGALANLTSGQKMEGWKSVYYPLMLQRGGEEEEVPADPRKDPWNVKPVDQKTAQAYLEQAARSVSASFNFPENWNPPVNSAPRSGPIESSLPKLASAAKGKYEEVFLLQRGRRGVGGRERRAGEEDEGPRFASNDEEGGGGFRFGGGRGGNREAMEQRRQAELEKMPADRRAALQKEMDDRKAFFNSLKDLPPDQQQARMVEFFNQPEMQQAADNAQAQRDARNSPQQRASRADSYLARKSAATGGAKP